MLHNIQETEQFENFCREHNILNLYDKSNKKFPHYRIIKISGGQPVVSFWETEATWHEGIFVTGIYINGGRIVTMNELPQEFDISVKRMEELLA